MKKVFFTFLTVFFFEVSTFAVEADSIPAIDLQEVKVFSVRAGDKTPVAYSNMSREEIEQNNFGQDIPILLTLTPSVIATSDAGTGIGYTGFRVRGTDANRINITANGIPLNDSESHGVFWVNMPDFASSLQDLQIQRGVGTSTNGAGAFGASVNMRTENIPAVAYGELNGGYGSFNTSKATLKLGSGLIKNHWTLDTRLSSIASDGFIDRASVDLKSYFAQGAYRNEKTLLKFITFGGKECTYHAWDGVPSDILASGNRTYNPCGFMGNDADGNPVYYENQTDNYQQTHYQFILLQELTRDLKLHAALHYTHGQGYYEEYKLSRELLKYGLKNFVNETGETIKKSDLVRQKHLDNDFGGGIFSLDYQKNKLNASLGGGANYYDGKHFGYVTWIKNYAFDVHFAPNHEYYRSTGEKWDANTYLKANYQVLKKLNLYGDLQYRYIHYTINGKNDVWDGNIGEMQKLQIDEKFHFFNPKAGIFYDINKKNKAYLSVAIAHREPNRNNYTEADSHEIPKPERLTDYELGYKFDNAIFSAGANLYYMQYKDQLVLTGKVNEIGEPLTSNVPDSYRAGVEIVLGAKIASWLRWNGNITLSDNKIKNYTEYVKLYDENWEWIGQVENALKNTAISFSPNVIANSLFSVHYKEFRTLLQSSYVGKQYLDNTGNDSRSIHSYFVSNLIFAYTFKPLGLKELSVNVQLNNLFNRKYETNGLVYSSYQQIDGQTGLRNTEIAYFPQAGTNLMVNVCVRF